MGGGWGDPLDRDLKLVAADVREGYISAAAVEDYGKDRVTRPGSLPNLRTACPVIF